MTTHVLLMCPHSAGKSLAAATYLRAAAARLGADVTISVAGPDPDAENMPTVVQALTEQGFSIAWQPRLVSEADTNAADTLISIGCDHPDIPTDRKLIEWDVPLISQDLTGSLQAIHDRAEALAHEISAAGKADPSDD